MHVNELSLFNIKKIQLEEEEEKKRYEKYQVSTVSVKLFSFVFVLFLLQRLHFLHFNSIILKTNKPNKNRNIKKERKLINGQRRLKVLIHLLQFFF